MPANYKFIRNHESLVSRFGEWPSFHDAEVVWLRLDRAGPSVEVAIYVFRTPGQLDENGYFKRLDESIVQLRFSGVSELSISDLNEQNVLGGLTLQCDSDKVRVRLHPLYGLGGEFSCESVEVVGVNRVP
jgi:hypothetical protein